MNDALFNEILDDVTKLLHRAAHPRRGTVTIGAETLAALEASDTVPIADSAQGNDELAQLSREVSACTKCALCETRTQTVFADGNPNADIVFVGEAPGEQEDRQGVPFVGRAGQLLTDIIHKGMKLDRKRDTYICNVLKCRPPGNRNPSPEEMNLCEPYLVRQLDLVQPKVIVALGGVASKALLKTDESVGRLRGRWHEYHGIPLRVTYHPAYLLRNEADKGKTWADIQEVMRYLAENAGTSA